VGVGGEGATEEGVERGGGGGDEANYVQRKV